MTDDETQQKLKAVAAVLAMYRVEMTAVTAVVWAESLRDLSLPEVEFALQAHVRDPERGRFPPLPADLLRQLDGDADAMAADSWAAFQRGDALDEVAEEALQVIGGRYGFGMANPSSNPSLGRIFVKHCAALYRKDAAERRAAAAMSRALGVDAARPALADESAVSPIFAQLAERARSRVRR